MANVVAKKPSKSFLKEKIVNQSIAEPIISNGGNSINNGESEDGKDVFMAENLPTYAKSYILPRKMHRAESKEKVRDLPWKKIVTILGAWNQKEKRCCSGIPNVYAEGTATVNARVSKEYNGLKTVYKVL